MAEKKTYRRMRFGDWETLHEIGSGNFGEAHKARYLPNGTLGVIKFLKMDPLKDRNNEYEIHFKTLVSELETLRKFDSPYINKVYDWDLRADKPWIALQFFNGATVIEQVNENGPISEENWWKLAHDLLTALKYIHSKGKVHRDLNPKNILLVFEGAKIIDFGISRIEGASLTSSHFYGADGYMAPEHVALSPDFKNDVFVAATILSLAGTGRIPWQAGSPPRIYEEAVKNGQPNYTGLNQKQIALVKPMHAKSLSSRISVDEALALHAELTSSIPKQDPAPARAVKTARVAPESTPVRAPITIGTRGSSSMSIGAFLEKNKLVIALGLFTGGWGLIPYWIWRQLKKKDSVPGPQIGVYIASIFLSVVSIGYLTFIPLFYWARRYRSKNILGMGIAAVGINFATYRVLALENSAGELPSWAGFYILCVYIAIFLVHRYMYFYVKTGEAPVKGVKKEKKKSKDEAPVVAETPAPVEEPIPAPATAPAVEPVAEVSDPNATTGDNSWSVVESTIFEYLAARKGKQFTIEILSNAYTGIYFQGYSEPGGYITVEAASNISVKPPLEAENRKGLIKIGWEPPSDGLPNFIKFLDLKESENSEIAKLFVETLQDGYKLEIGTFKVEV